MARRFIAMERLSASYHVRVVQLCTSTGGQPQSFIQSMATGWETTRVGAALRVFLSPSIRRYTAHILLDQA